MKIITQLPIRGFNWELETRSVESMISHLTSLLDGGFVPRERPRRQGGRRLSTFSTTNTQIARSKTGYHRPWSPVEAVSVDIDSLGTPYIDDANPNTAGKLWIK